MSEIVLAILSGGVAGAIVSGVISYFVSIRLDREQRVQEQRKIIYSEIHDVLAGFFTTADKTEERHAKDNLTRLFRQSQIWGSPEMVKKFNSFLEAMDVSRPQDEKNRQYRELIIRMRQDLTGETISYEDIKIYGKIT